LVSPPRPSTLATKPVPVREGTVGENNKPVFAATTERAGASKLVLAFLEELARI